MIEGGVEVLVIDALPHEGVTGSSRTPDSRPRADARRPLVGLTLGRLRRRRRQGEQLDAG